MSYLNYLSLISFKQMHPSWKVILMRPLHADAHAPAWATGEQGNVYRGEDYTELAELIVDEVRRFDFSELGFSNIMHDVHKADLLRQYLMATQGGVWSDMDVLWINHIEEMNCPPDTSVMLVWKPNVNRPYYSTGIVFSKPHTAYHEVIFDACVEAYDPTEYQSLGPSLLRDLFPTEKHVRDYEKDCVIYNAPYETFYPIHYRDLHRLFEQAGQAPLPIQTVAVHWFGGARLAQKHQKLLTPETLYKYRDTMLGAILEDIDDGL